MDNNIELEVSKNVKKIQRIERKKKQKEYINSLREKEKYNRSSIWLNFIAFFIPVLGIFWGFFNLLKRPKRAKSLFIITFISLLLQSGLFIFCYMFLFDYLGNLCITLFG